jgi:ankyrin repeat protein
MTIRLLAFTFFLCCLGSIATSQSCDKVCQFGQWVSTTATDFAANFKFRWENGNDINARGKKQETRLHLAILDGRPSKIQALIKAGADVMARDYWGNTPLDWAIKRGDTAIIRILLDAEAEVMATEKDGANLQPASENKRD